MKITKTITTPTHPSQDHEQPTSAPEQARESIHTDTGLKTPKNGLKIDSVPNERVETGTNGPSRTGASERKAGADTPNTSGAESGADSQGSQGAKQVRTGTKTATKTGTAANSPATDSNQNREQATGTDKSTVTDKSGTELTKTGASTNQVRRRGERGADKAPRKKRTDFNLSKQVPADERQQIVRYNMEMFMLGKLDDPNDIDQVRDRIAAYFTISDKYQQAPTVAGLALALGIDRRTLWTWMERKSGAIKNPEVMDTLKNVYNMITSQYESLLTQNKIVPVAGFFLMQNNFGYKNQTDHVVVAQQAEDPDTGEIAARAGLLEDGQD